MAKPRVVYVFSKLKERTHYFEWIFDSKLSKRVELSVVSLCDDPQSPFNLGLRSIGVPLTHIPLNSKRDVPLATAQLARHFSRVEPAVVHTHLLEANLAGLTAAWLAGVKRRLLTRHHSNSNHVYARHAVLYDQLTHRLATQVIATCENGREILRDLEGVPDEKIRVVNFGLPPDLFSSTPLGRIEGARTRFRVNGKGPIVGVAARYVEWKGIQDIIRGFKGVLATHPNACLVLANAYGAYAPKLRAELDRLPQDSYREVPFEVDMPAFYGMLDAFVHAPINERIECFGLVYIEALAASRPSIFTKSGIAREFVRDGENALVVPFQDPKAIELALLRLLADPTLGKRLAERGRADVEQRFGFDRMIDQLTALYT